MKSNESITVKNYGEHWICVCGNSTMDDGFDTCDSDGVYIEPLDYWTGLYACLKCGRIIDQDTYQVLSKTDNLDSFGINIIQ